MPSMIFLIIGHVGKNSIKDIKDGIKNSWENEDVDLDKA